MALTALLLDRGGSAEVTLDRASLEAKLESGDFFWLDLRRPSADELELVGDVFGFHQLALEDSRHFDQRPKLEEYDDFVLLVVYGWAPDEDGLVEVHCYYSEQFLVTIRRDEAPAFSDVRPQCERTLTAKPGGIHVLHLVVDALVDSFNAPLDRFNDRLELIEEEMLRRPSDAFLQDILTMRRRLATLRRMIAPQRDVFGRLASGAAELPGMTAEAERYFRDVYDHLFRVAEMIDTFRDLMTGAMDVYLSTTSNRLGAVTKQLAVIATIFLPLTFVTGFFGQNFGWMVGRVDGWIAFVALGIGLQLVVLAFLFGYFKRQGWF